jgi:hypothetical protein
MFLVSTRPLGIHAVGFVLPEEAAERIETVSRMFDAFRGAFDLGQDSLAAAG